MPIWLAYSLVSSQCSNSNNNNNRDSNCNNNSQSLVIRVEFRTIGILFGRIANTFKLFWPRCAIPFDNGLNFLAKIFTKLCCNPEGGLGGLGLWGSPVTRPNEKAFTQLFICLTHPITVSLPSSACAVLTYCSSLDMQYIFWGTTSCTTSAKTC